jgi:hypothetical protein
MKRRHATLAATLAGLTLLAAGCGGGGGSEDAGATAPTDPAALLVAADGAAATPSGLTALGVTAPDPADGRYHAYGTFGTPANVFKPLIKDPVSATTVVPSTLVPTTVPTTVTTPTTGTTTTSTGAPLVP